MSIRIDSSKCISCGKCLRVCPGNLLYKDNKDKAYIKYPKDCWGCTACLKECRAGAIYYYLGADMGGDGNYMYTNREGNLLRWNFVMKTGKKISITLEPNEANKY